MGIANAAAASILHGIGFTQAGISAGSFAASMMSAAAKAKILGAVVSAG